MQAQLGTKPHSYNLGRLRHVTHEKRLPQQIFHIEKRIGFSQAQNDLNVKSLATAQEE